MYSQKRLSVLARNFVRKLKPINWIPMWKLLFSIIFFCKCRITFDTCNFISHRKSHQKQILHFFNLGFYIEDLRKYCFWNTGKIFEHNSTYNRQSVSGCHLAECTGVMVSRFTGNLENLNQFILNEALFSLKLNAGWILI